MRCPDTSFYLFGQPRLAKYFILSLLEVHEGGNFIGWWVFGMVKVVIKAATAAIDAAPPSKNAAEGNEQSDPMGLSFCCQPLGPDRVGRSGPRDNLE